MRPRPRPATMLLLLLCPALAFTSASLPTGAGLPADSTPTRPHPMQEVPPPALNLTFDPGTWTLTWLCSDDITVTSCSANQTLHGRLKKHTMKVTSSPWGALGDSR